MRLVRLVPLWLLVACRDDPSGPAQEPSKTDASPPSPPPFVVAPTEVGSVVAPIRQRYDVPGLAVLVFQNGTVIAEGASGVRRLGADAPLTRSDAFFLGGATQTITATLAAVLVERGLVSWSETLASALPGVPMHVAYNNVTLEALVGQRGGAPDALSAELDATARGPGDVRDRRRRVVGSILVAAPASEGTYRESDASLLLATAILEAKTGRAWEELVATEIFAPLGITTCGTVTDDVGDAPTVPWGHVGSSPVAPGSPGEPPRALAPALGIRCGLEDVGRFAAFHLQGARAASGYLLGAPSFAKLQTPFELSHAYGWEAVSRTWAGASLALNARSRDASSYAVVWVLPDKNTVIVAATNVGGTAAEKATDDIVLELVGKFVPPS